RGVEFAPMAAEHLIRAVEGDLGQARSELDKLTGLGGGEPVTLDQVSALLGVRHGETASDWCEAVLADRTGPAAAMLSQLLDQSGVSGVSLLTQLGTNLIGLALTRAHFDRGARGGGLEKAAFDSLLRARPARLDYRGSVARWCRVVEAWPRARVDSAIAAACRADRRLKDTTLADERAVLLDLVMLLGQGAGVPA